MTTADTGFSYALPEGYEEEYMGWCNVHPWHRIDTIDAYYGPGWSCDYGSRGESYFQTYDRLRPDTLVGRVCPLEPHQKEIDPLIDDPLAQKLNFPWMILNRDHTIRVPLEEAIVEAQRSIDEGLAELTEEQRRRYLSATSTLGLPLFPSGEYHLITLEKGRLRLRDDVAAAEAIARYRDWGGVAPSLDMVRTASEVRAYRKCGTVANGHIVAETPAIWESLLPYIRDGRICCADLSATYFNWDTLEHLDRASVCRSFRRLITQEGWPIAYAAEAIDFIASLHFVAGDTDYDAAEELIAARPVFEEFLARHPDTWDRVTGEAEFALWHMSSLGWEEYCARYRPAVHGIIESLGQLDVEGAVRWLRVYDKVRSGVFDSIEWSETIFDRIDVGEDDMVCYADDLLEDESDGDDDDPMPDPIGWMASLDEEVAFAVVKRLDDHLTRCSDTATAYGQFAKEQARLAALERTAALQSLLHDVLNLEVGTYVARMFEGGRPFLAERVQNLIVRAGRLMDELAVVPQGSITAPLERELLFVCVEAMAGVPMVFRREGTSGRGLRYRVEVPSGGYDIAEKRLGVDGMLQDHPEMEAVLEKLDDEGWEVLWEALKNLWECLLIADCELKPWPGASFVGPSLATEEGRVAAFVALLHSKVKELAQYVGDGHLSIKRAYSWTMRLYEPLDKGLEKLGMPPTGLGERLGAIYKR